MKTMTLLATALLGAATFAGTAGAASNADMSAQTYKMRHAQHTAHMKAGQREGSMRTSIYGAPRARSFADENNRSVTKNNTPDSASSGTLTIPGSGTAIYSYSGSDKNRQYGY